MKIQGCRLCYYERTIVHSTRKRGEYLTIHLQLMRGMVATAASKTFGHLLLLVVSRTLHQEGSPIDSDKIVHAALASSCHRVRNRASVVGLHAFKT